MFSVLSRFAPGGATHIPRISELFSSISKTLLPSASAPTICKPDSTTSAINTTVPARHKCFAHHFLNRWMYRDYKRRLMVTENFPVRQRLIAIKRCSVLPKEIQEEASHELHTMPPDVNPTRVVNRCILTSRPRWVIYRYRLSRIQLRNLADYNKLSGFTRARW
ncbi:small ribosomal subunit protein uS14m-like [Physella acuta]|uniref:small ribosomal subunit protein uS14m-like n=1 Tax=Physella acuta TaxID=109671 RepID=UPI0027DD68AE|nr:small ribosomal subunit protein uS14m-like [Physella acuta]